MRGVITMKTVCINSRPSTFFITIHSSTKVRFIALLTALFFLASPLNISAAYAQEDEIGVPTPPEAAPVITMEEAAKRVPEEELERQPTDTDFMSALGVEVASE